MEPNEEYKCDYLPGETLVTTKKYNDKMYVVRSFETGRSFIVGINTFGEPHLCFAHVSDDACALKKIVKEKT